MTPDRSGPAAMDNNAIIALVLSIDGDLSIDGCQALVDNSSRIDSEILARLNKICPRGTAVGKREVEQALRPKPLAG